MTCNYFTYRDMTEKMFYGCALTNEHMNNAIEQIRVYLVNGGAGQILSALGIGIRVVTQEGILLPRRVLERRFIYLSGENKGRELTISEIQAIGLFLKHGPYEKYLNR